MLLCRLLLRSLFASLLFAHVMAHCATGCRADESVLTGDMSGNTADHCAFEATGIRDCGYRSEGQCEG